MARVLYGVMGNTNGHTVRSLAIATRLPEHEFYFVGGWRVPEVLRERFPLLEVPVKRTFRKHHRLRRFATNASLVRCLGALPRVSRQIMDLIERWQPHLAICDREFFLPHAARAAKLKCLSIDHSQLLKACDYAVPPEMRRVWRGQRSFDRVFFDHAEHNLIVSFFQPPLLPSNGYVRNELFPPVLRQEVTDLQPTHGDHVLLYLTGPIFPELITAVKELVRPVIVYGVRNERAQDGNLTFKPFDPRSLLEDLASCAYAVCHAGHNLICEALYYGKPVMCFPVAEQFEQFLNAWYVRELGYGDFARHPSAELFQRFEQRLGEFGNEGVRASINGTAQVVARVREIIAQCAGQRPKDFTPRQAVR